jgi:hypothetical protein
MAEKLKKMADIFLILFIRGLNLNNKRTFAAATWQVLRTKISKNYLENLSCHRFLTDHWHKKIVCFILKVEK